MAPTHNECSIRRHTASRILIAAALVVLCSIRVDTAAQEPISPAPAVVETTNSKQFLIQRNPPPTIPLVDLQTGAEPSQTKEKGEDKDKDKGKEKGKGEGAGKKKEWDAGEVSAGEGAFNRGCVKCHNAARSLEKNKDYAGWLMTVRRMAAMREAEVPSSDIVPITVYLTSRNPDAAPQGGGGGGNGGSGAAASGEKKGEAASTFSAFATLSPYWRGGSTTAEFNGFVPESFFGASWHSEVVSARVMACATCHASGRFEIAESAVTVDFSKWLQDIKPGMKGSIEGGRFFVPFSAQSAAPMLYRTVVRPLIFEMGQGVYPNQITQVLPIPYADEGANANLSVPLFNCCDQQFRVNATGYIVNGLQGDNNGINFNQSQPYVDNNGRPAVGTRLTAGIPQLRVGYSLMQGDFNVPGNNQVGGTNAGTAVARNLSYTIYGVDLVATHENLIRFQAEYGKRSQDRFGIVPPSTVTSVFQEVVDGYYFELEARPTNDCPISALFRYDRLNRDSVITGGTAAGTNVVLPNNYNVQRYTWGININLWRDSLLMFNHEIFHFSAALPHLQLFGVKYLVSF